MQQTTPSLRTRCANAIDTSWHSSWHWPERDWYGKALKDAKHRRDQNIEKLSELQQVIYELESIVADESAVSAHATAPPPKAGKP